MQSIIPYIGVDRFFIYCWFDLETNNYRSLCKFIINPIVTIDATGGCVQKINLIFRRKTDEIFPYEMVACNKKE